MAENSADIAKRIILGCVAEGMTIEAACGSAGKSLKTYEYYRRTDKIFADKVDRTRLGLKDKAFASGDVHDIDFAEFRQKFLHSRTFPHQQNLVDVIEGREPSWLHPSMKFEPGLASNRVLINIPPNHAKSITITVDYVTWKVAQNPNFRVLIVSQTQQLAADFLYAIKQRLTHPMYQDLQAAYAAGVGFNSKSASWQATRVTFGDELRESSEKDPNIEAVGIGGQIYGKRADMIIVDDAVTLKNANEFEKQIRWLTQDVRSRLNPTGKLIIIGTRVASVDLYRELRSEDRYPGGQVPWKYLAMPALLEVDEDPDKWVTLWPASDAPFDGQEEADKILLEEQNQARLQSARQQEQEFKTSIQETLSEMDDYNGLKFTAEDKTSLVNYLTKKNHKIDDTRSVTEFQVKLQEAFKEPKKVALLAKLLRSDFDFSTIAKTAVTKKTKEIKRNIEQRQNTRPNGSGSSIGGKDLASLFDK